MAKRSLSREEIVDTIKGFISCPNTYDYPSYIKYSGKRGLHDTKRMLEFAKDNLSVKLYGELWQKLFPFEPIDDKAVEEKLEFKNKVLKLAEDFADKKIAYFHLQDELNVDLNRFYYFARQLSYQYKDLPRSKLKTIEDFYVENKGYDACQGKITLDIPSLDSKELEIILNEIESRNIPYNNKTFMMMYDYYKKHLQNNKMKAR